MQLIEKFRKERGFKDYYQALDSLGVRTGIEFMVLSVWDEDKGKVASFIACLKLKHGNKESGDPEIIELREFKSENKAYEYIAKEQVYRLRSIGNLKEIIL